MTPYEMDLEQAKQRVIARGIERAEMETPCDCRKCLARIVEESKANWPNCALEVGR